MGCFVPDVVAPPPSLSGKAHALRGFRGAQRIEGHRDRAVHHMAFPRKTYLLTIGLARSAATAIPPSVNSTIATGTRD